MIEVTHRLVVQEVGQDEAAVLLLPRKGFVVVAIEFLLVTQGEDFRQGVQLGSDVGLQKVLALPPPPLHIAVSTNLQKLPEEGHRRVCSKHRHITSVS